MSTPDTLPGVGGTLYRATGRVTDYESGHDDFGILRTDVSVHFTEYRIERETKKGWWVTEKMFGWSYPRNEVFVLKPGTGTNPGKRLCYPTKEQALYSLHRRTRMRVYILKRQLRNAGLILDKLKELDGKPPEAPTHSKPSRLDLLPPG